MKKSILTLLLCAVLSIGLTCTAFATVGWVDDGEGGVKLGIIDESGEPVTPDPGPETPDPPGPVNPDPPGPVNPDPPGPVNPDPGPTNPDPGPSSSGTTEPGNNGSENTDSSSTKTDKETKPETPSTSPLPVDTVGQSSSVEATTTIAAPEANTQDGKAVTVVDGAIGDEIVRQAVSNKSEEVVIAPSVTGDVTRAEVSIPAAAVGQIGSQTSADLTVSTPVADVTIPNSGLSSLSSAGGDVTIAAEKSGSTVELSVTAGGRTVTNVPGGVTLTVPVSNATTGTVAVVVHEDGTREVVRKSVADGGTLTIPLDGSARLEIVDNSKRFDDVPDTNWASNAVAFVSARELFNGTGENQFSPDLPMNRGMLAVVLHNLENKPEQDITSAFTDVGTDAWYAEGVSWAVAKGIVTGYGNGQFGPGDNITREQLAVMLWRYAGSPAATGGELHFIDADQVNDWAVDALRWATEMGIINGKGNGILDPGGFATRAETAKMLQNFMQK